MTAVPSSWNTSPGISLVKARPFDRKTSILLPVIPSDILAGRIIIVKRVEIVRVKKELILRMNQEKYREQY